MASALDLMDARDCQEDDIYQEGSYCKRARFAALWGGICGLFCLVWTFVGSRYLPEMADTLARLLVVVPWAAAVALDQRKLQKATDNHDAIQALEIVDEALRSI